MAKRVRVFDSFWGKTGTSPLPLLKKLCLDFWHVCSEICAEVEREASHRCLPGEAGAWQGKEGFDDTLKCAYSIDGIWQTKFHGRRLHHQLQPLGKNMYKSILGYHHFESKKNQQFHWKKPGKKGARGQTASCHGWWRVPKVGVAMRTSQDQIFLHIIWFMISYRSNDWMDKSWLKLSLKPSW